MDMKRDAKPMPIYRKSSLPLPVKYWEIINVAGLALTESHVL